MHFYQTLSIWYILCKSATFDISYVSLLKSFFSNSTQYKSTQRGGVYERLIFEKYLYKHLIVDTDIVIYTYQCHSLIRFTTLYLDVMKR